MAERPRSLAWTGGLESDHSLKNPSGAPLSRNRPNGRLRSLTPAAMATARLHPRSRDWRDDDLTRGPQLVQQLRRLRVDLAEETGRALEHEITIQHRFDLSMTEVEPFVATAISCTGSFVTLVVGCALGQVVEAATVTDLVTRMNATSSPSAA